MGTWNPTPQMKRGLGSIEPSPGILPTPVLRQTTELLLSTGLAGTYCVQQAGLWLGHLRAGEEVFGPQQPPTWQVHNSLHPLLCPFLGSDALGTGDPSQIDE